MKKNRFIFWLAFAGVVAAPFVYWPLGVIGIVLAAASEYWTLSILGGVILDVLYGVPPANFHSVFFPLTLFAIVAIVIRIASEKYVLKRGREETL